MQLIPVNELLPRRVSGQLEWRNLAETLEVAGCAIGCDALVCAAHGRVEFYTRFDPEYAINLASTRSFFLFGLRGTGKSTLLSRRFSGQDIIWLDLLLAEDELK